MNNCRSSNIENLPTTKWSISIQSNFIIGFKILGFRSCFPSKLLFLILTVVTFTAGRRCRFSDFKHTLQEPLPPIVCSFKESKDDLKFMQYLQLHGEEYLPLIGHCLIKIWQQIVFPGT